MFIPDCIFSETKKSSLICLHLQIQKILFNPMLKNLFASKPAVVFGMVHLTELEEL